VPVHVVGIGSADFTATSAQAVVNGDVQVNVGPRPQMLGHWFSGAASLADTSGFRPAGTHDGVAIGSTPGNLAYSSDVPNGFTGQSLNLTAGGVVVSIQNSATGDAGYLPTFDTLMSTNFTIAFWAKGLPNSWSAWLAKDGDDNVGYQVRRYGGDNHAAFTIRGTSGPDDAEGNVDLTDTTVWHQYTAVWNGSAGTRQLYIDGTLDTRVNVTGDTSPFASPSGYHLLIGGQQSSSGNPANAFPGLLFDVRIYNNALSPAGIQSLLSPTSTVIAPNLTVQRSIGQQVRIAWPASAAGYSLQQSTNVLGIWGAADLTINVEGSENAIYVSPTNGAQFFRLTK
jgi:hypothetical protein